jgi:hypothetical protein
VIDLRKHRDLCEDLYDRAVAKQREGEPRESLASVKQRLRPSGQASPGWLTMRSPSPARRDATSKTSNLETFAYLLGSKDWRLSRDLPVRRSC